MPIAVASDPSVVELAGMTFVPWAKKALTAGLFSVATAFCTRTHCAAVNTACNCQS